MFGNTETNFRCFIILTSALAMVLVSFWMSALRCRSSSTNSISKSLQYLFCNFVADERSSSGAHFRKEVK